MAFNLDFTLLPVDRGVKAFLEATYFQILNSIVTPSVADKFEFVKDVSVPTIVFYKKLQEPLTNSLGQFIEYDKIEVTIFNPLWESLIKEFEASRDNLDCSTYQFDFINVGEERHREALKILQSFMTYLTDGSQDLPSIREVVLGTCEPKVPCENVDWQSLLFIAKQKEEDNLLKHQMLMIDSVHKQLSYLGAADIVITCEASKDFYVGYDFNIEFTLGLESFGASAGSQSRNFVSLLQRVYDQVKDYHAWYDTVGKELIDNIKQGNLPLWTLHSSNPKENLIPIFLEQYKSLFKAFIPQSVLGLIVGKKGVHIRKLSRCLHIPHIVLEVNPNLVEESYAIVHSKLELKEPIDCAKEFEDYATSAALDALLAP